MGRGREGRGRGRGRGRIDEGNKDHQISRDSLDNNDHSLDDVAASSTITMAVPELLIGNILGKNGSAIREIAFLSGAKISVSSRGEYVAGTTNRIVSITGVSKSAQTAHNLISQKLQQVVYICCYVLFVWNN
jgi:polyribonucleotide nucleotidyltransferase